MWGSKAVLHIWFVLFLFFSALLCFVLIRSHQDPLYVSNSTFVASQGSSVAMRGRHTSSFLGIDSSEVVAEQIGLESCEFKARNGSSFLAALVVASSSSIGIADSNFTVFGTVQAQNQTVLAATGSSIFVQGGLALFDSSFGISASAFSAAANSDLGVSCTAEVQPLFTDYGLQSSCEVALYGSQFSVEGTVTVTGRFALLSIVFSTGAIRAANSTRNFIITNGAHMTALYSTISVSSSLVVANQSQIICENSTLSIGAFLGVLNGSTFYANIYTNISMNQGLYLDGGSGLLVSNNSRFNISGFILAKSSVLIARFGGRFELTSGGGVQLEGGAWMELQSGGALVGAGFINGTLINLGGIVTSSGSGTTNITVDTYNSTSNANSTLATNVGGNGTSSTVINSQIAIIGGVVVVTINSTLNQQLLANATSLGSVLLITAQNLTGTLPRLIVQLSDGSTIDVILSNGSATGCGYRLEQSTVSLSLVFDQYGCPAPPSSMFDPFNSNSSLPGWVIPVAVVGGVVVLAALVAALVWFVPSLRARFIPVAAWKFRSRRLANISSKSLA
jgi:hypothetical protein